MVTPDEIPDISEETLATRFNGVEVQAAPTTDLMIFDMPALIAYCSTFTELVARRRHRHRHARRRRRQRTPPLYMKAGDVVEIEIAGIGVLRNTVKDEVAAAATRAA